MVSGEWWCGSGGGGGGVTVGDVIYFSYYVFILDVLPENLLGS